TLDADGSGSISLKELLPSPEPRQKEWSLMTTDEKWNRYLGESVQHPEKRASSDDEDDGSAFTRFTLAFLDGLAAPLKAVGASSSFNTAVSPDSGAAMERVRSGPIARDKEARLRRLLKLEREKNFMRLNKTAYTADGRLPIYGIRSQNVSLPYDGASAADLEKERLVEEHKARRAIVSQHRSNTVLSSVQFGVDALIIPEEIDEDLLSDNESEDSAEIRRRQQFERRR
ncbi:hypothetical protein FOZ63_031452, partial [Perkinsus olseni]